VTVVVIGKTLADAQGYADKHGLVGAALISPPVFPCAVRRVAGGPLLRHSTCFSASEHLANGADRPEVYAEAD